MPTKAKFLFFSKIFNLLLFEGMFTSVVKDSKKSKNSRNQGFSYFFCLLLEGSRSVQNMKDPGGPQNETGYYLARQKPSMDRGSTHASTPPASMASASPRSINLQTCAMAEKFKERQA
jgi:hypothetical protein